MAIQKKIITEFGVDASYWHIGAKAEDFRRGAVDITLYGYANEEKRRDGCSPLGVAQIHLNGDAYTADASRESLYASIKNLDEWSDSVDC